MSKTVYLEKSDIGATLTTWIYCGMWMLYAAEQMGMRGYINWPQRRNRSLEPYQDKARFAVQPNMYLWYFEQPLFSSPPHCDEVWEWEQCPHLGNHAFMSQPLPFIKEWYRKHLRFSVDVNARGQALVAKYGIDFTKMIGVSWRGTDCVTDGRPRIPIEAYFRFIDEIIAGNPDMRIMCTAEEEHVLEPLLRRYPTAFKIQEFFSSPSGSLQNPERFSPFSGFERGMQPALMVWLFSKCAHYIKNRSSTGAVACWLSTGRIVNIAHPENLGYDKMDDQVEIEGVRSPLYL
jgi:hypothetical protein